MACTMNITSMSNNIPMMMKGESSSSSSSSSSSFENVHERLRRLNLDYEQEAPDLLNTSLRSNASHSSSCMMMEMSAAGNSSSSPTSIIQQVRREVTKLLELFLQDQLLQKQQKLQNYNNTSSSSSSSAQKQQQQRHKLLAIQLEQRLFDAAPTFGDYCNTKTLESRLKVIMKAMQSRLMNKQKRILNTKLRSQTLKARMGQDMYQKTETIVQTIKFAKNELVGSSCAKCHVKEGPKASAFTGTTTSSSSTSKTLPQPVKALFFQTPIVDAFDKYSLQRLETVDWDRLLAQAERNVQAYYEWKAENYVCYR